MEMNIKVSRQGGGLWPHKDQGINQCIELLDLAINMMIKYIYLYNI